MPRVHFFDIEWSGNGENTERSWSLPTELTVRVAPDCVDFLQAESTVLLSEIIGWGAYRCNYEVLPDNIEESDLINKDGSVNREKLLDSLWGIEQNLSHANDCPYRHCGECLCPRSDLLNLIDELQRVESNQP